jgi:rhodanese-related sulfurtransferase
MSKKPRNSGRQQQPHSHIPMLVLLIGVAILAIIALGAFFIPRLNNGTTAQSLPLEISVAEAAAKRDAGAFILDVREPSEWTDFHMQGATLIPLGSLASRINDVPRDKDVVVMCRTGHRSSSGRDILLSAGFTRVTSMAGGLTEWRSQGLQTVSGN